MQARRLAHALRQHHDPAAVEQQHQRQFETAHHLQDARAIVGVCVNETLPGVERNVATAKLSKESVGHRRRQHRRMAGSGEIHHRTVFRDDAVYEVQIAGDPRQFAKDSTGDEKHENAAGSERRNRLPHRFIGTIPDSDRAIVVEGHSCELHDRFIPFTTTTRVSCSLY
jgi:hypothetical protein